MQICDIIHSGWRQGPSFFPASLNRRITLTNWIHVVPHEFWGFTRSQGFQRYQEYWRKIKTIAEYPNCIEDASRAIRSKGMQQCDRFAIHQWCIINVFNQFVACCCIEYCLCKLKLSLAEHHGPPASKKMVLLSSFLHRSNHMDVVLHADFQLLKQGKPVIRK